MFENYKTFKTDFAGRPLVVETGKLAGLANGSCLVRYGDTAILCCATASARPRDGIDFLPLSVDFEERMYAVGRIPGGYLKREGRPSEKAILTSRVIDRPIRPLFPKDMRNDVAVCITVLSVEQEYGLSREAVVRSLLTAGLVGQIIGEHACLAGAQGGCQAECGSASAMAAAALCHLKGGTPEQCAAAAAMALGNLLGLVCDPVAGLVEVPCIKRNVVGAVNAVSCANMALAGVDYAIPCDEVIDAMGRVGSLLSPDLRETGQGGLAATPTGVRIAERLAEEA